MDELDDRTVIRAVEDALVCHTTVKDGTVAQDCFNYPSLENNGDLSDGGDGIVEDDAVFVEDGGGILLTAGKTCIGKDRNGSTPVEDEDNMTNVPLSWAGESFWDEVIAIEKTMDEKVDEGNGARNNTDSAEMESEDYDFDLMGDFIEREYPNDWDPLKVGLGLEVGSTSGKDIVEKDAMVYR
ncbi:unnamed protein product [Arabis nemorensis]|uniref:Uncharacterized protein n=1 Tax=Arabis nemorensis TaxID=586526 RepID=A0A565CTN6_9BRAS|nr:unnamed protein product [Arabis nemorensis]